MHVSGASTAAALLLLEGDGLHAANCCVAAHAFTRRGRQ